jgi:hypothetical protein
MGLLTADKYKPTLFVGLGGNGGKIVNLLASKLRRHPHWSRIQSMTHFLVIDTNKDDLDKLRAVSPDCRFLISSFDRRAYVARKRGQAELAPDPLVNQWVHPDYVFRAAQGAGAGQIRLESRLGLYYNLEDDTRAGIRRKITDILHQSTSRENPWRDNEDKVVQLMLYASVAGGTGSGGFLPMAYLLGDAVHDFGWGRPSMVSVLTLPTTFLDRVKPQLHADIMANGYAGLKELEYLTRQLGYAGGAEEIEFHYDPGSQDRSRQFVTERPFGLTYLVDRPADISIDRYEHAIADACYLQMFSPVLGAQAGEYDNYDKHQKTLAQDAFAVQYAAFGTAILHLPRRDLIRYAGLRYTARAFREFLCFGGEEPQFRVPYGDPTFERLDTQEKERIADEKFEGYVAWRAAVEEQANEKGVFSAIHAQTGAGGKSLPLAFRQRLESIYGRLDELVQIPDIERQAINPGNPSLARPLAVLRKEYADSRTRVRGHLEAQISELRTGRLFGAFFEELQVNPMAQRLFAIRLLRDAIILPFEDAAEGEFLKPDGAPRTDLDGSVVQEEVARLEAELTRTATPGLFKRVVDSENKDFQAAKARAVRKYEELAQDHREDLRRYFWRAFEAELRQAGGALLGAFRKVAEVADDSARIAEAEAEQFRRDPGAVADSDVAAYYLDAEALRDDRRRERLWHLFYAQHLDKSAFFDVKAIFATITSAFAPARNPDGRPRSRDAGEIVGLVRTQLNAQAQTVYERALDDLHLDLGRALDYEQRYIDLLDRGLDFEALRRTNTLDDEVRAVPAARVEQGIEDKLKRVAAECVLLAHIDPTKRDDPGVKPANVFFAGLHDRFNTDEPGALGALLKKSVAGVSFVAGWDEPNALVLYRALLGVPLYWFKNIGGPMYTAYKTVRDNPNRSYPLHIEAAWETTRTAPGLPDLDPLELKHARDREAVERAARSARQDRAGQVRAFAVARLFGGVVEESGGFAWAFEGTQGALGKDFVSAFAAFVALDPTLRGDIVEGAEQVYRERKAERATRAKLREQVKAQLARARGAYARALADERDADRRFLEEERAILETLDADLAS